MVFRLVEAGWAQEIENAIKMDGHGLRIVAPFIKAKALERLLSHRPTDVKVITRFNLDDFAAGVSDIVALRRLLTAGASVRGVRNVHAKLYIFGLKHAIVTSANLTEAALNRNHEFGIVADETQMISSCLQYFDALWMRGAELTLSQLDTWESRVTSYLVDNPIGIRRSGLGDFGADAGITASPLLDLPSAAASAEQAFVKFFGQGSNRASLDWGVLNEVDRVGCHRTLSYPASKRPRGVKDGALMFIARLTKEPAEPSGTNIRVFGRAFGLAHDSERDTANPEEIRKRSFKVDWPHYIRLHHAEFVAGIMANGISLNALMDALGSDSFKATQRNHVAKKGNTNPRRAFMQQAAVELSEEGQLWLNRQLQDAFDRHGIVPSENLISID